MTQIRPRELLRAILSGLVLVVLGISLVLAQTTARLEGVVKDSTQAIIPGVTVTATHEGTNISYTSITNESGVYLFPNLTPGSYSLSSEMQGFKRYISKGLSLKVGDTVTLNIPMEIGEVSNEVIVSAAAPLIDTTSSKIGAVVQDKQILDLPLNGRNPMDLFLLQGGTSPLGGGSVDGLRTNANNTRVEGVWASGASYDGAPTSPNAVVPLDAVGEFRVTTSSASAEMGRGAGAQVSVVYKSGTNNFHGSVYEFNRNTLYNANNFFSNRTNTARPVFLRNQYGASIGGPIKKDKSFFFFNWEGQRQIQAAINNFTVYTQALRDGVFRFNKAAANATSNVDSKGNPLVAFGTINIFTVDPSRLGFDSSGIVARKLKTIPLPNNYDLGDGFNLAGYRTLSSNPNNGNQYVWKIDHTLSTKHQLSGSYGFSKYLSYGSFLFSGYRQSGSRQETKNLSIGLVSGFTPTITNELRVGGNRNLSYGLKTNPEGFDTKGNFQLSGLGSGRGGAPNGNPTAVFLPQRNPIVALAISDNLSWIKRNHSIKFGLEVVHTTKNNWFGSDEYIPAIYTLNAGNPANVPSQTGLASADRSRAQQMVNDLTGTIGHINQDYNANSYEKGFVAYDTRHRLMRQREWGAFFQDTWKLRQNLTVSFGSRWDLLPPAYYANGVATYPKGGAAAVYGISGPLGTYATGPSPDKGAGIADWDWNNFGPHLGFTWDPFKDGKTSVSAYFRVSYDRHMQSVYSRLEDQNQGMNIALTANPNTRFSDPNLHVAVGGKAAILPLPIPAPGTPFFPIPFTRESRAYALDQRIRTPYTEAWSLRIQHELSKDWFVQVAYVGNISVGGWRAININQIQIRTNGFLDGFLAAQRNLAKNGNPNTGESIGVLATLFAPMGGIPSSQNNLITQGQAAALANYADTTVFPAVGGVRGGLVTASKLPITFFRLNPQVLNANIADNLSVSTWHAMKLEVGKRLSRGAYFQFNYTLAKGISDYTGGQSQYDDFRDNLNRRLDKTLQNFDSHHIIQSNALYELPFGAGKRFGSSLSGWKGAILSGWQVNGIFTLATGRPLSSSSGYQNLTVGDASTSNFAGTNRGFTTVVKGNQITALTAADKALFSTPVAGSPGQTAQRSFRGPSTWNMDTSLFKNFRARFLGEQGQIQFRAEAFNTFNNVNFGDPNLSPTAGTFGQISSAESARILQFALKLYF